MRMSPIAMLMIGLVWLNLPASVARAETKALSSLQELSWQKRLLLIKSSAPDPVVTLLREAQAGIDERNIVWFVLQGDSLLSNLSGPWTAALKAQVGRILQDSDEGSLLLIGYDGQVKSRDNRLDIQRVFGQIDGMPIRRMEMSGQWRDR